MDQHVISNICNMSLDQLGEVFDLIKMRQQQLNLKKASSFKVNNKVKFNDKVRPKYLNGEIGTVKKVNPKTVVIDLDNTVGKWHKGIRVPYSLVDMF